MKIVRKFALSNIFGKNLNSATLKTKKTKKRLFVNEQRLSLSSAFYSALHSWLAHYCQRFDVSPALSFVGHDGDSVSTL